MNNARRHFASYHEWLVDDSTMSTFFIGRFENLQEDFDIICDRINHSRVILPHELKSTKKAHYSEYYTTRTIDLITEKYQKDLDIFKYTYSTDI